MKYNIILAFALIILASAGFSSALNVNIPITTSTNYSIVNVNNSVYWQGYTPASYQLAYINGSFVPYTGANQDVNLGTEYAYRGAGCFAPTANWYGWQTSTEGLTAYLNNNIYGSLTTSGWYFLNNNVVTDANMTASYYEGNGSKLKGICLSNGTGCASSGSSGWQPNNATENRNYSTTGNLNVAGRVITTNITNYQSSDLSSIRTYGYDDRSNDWVEMRINSGGVASMTSSSSWLLKATTNHIIIQTSASSGTSGRLSIQNLDLTEVASVDSSGNYKSNTGNLSLISGYVSAKHKSSDGTLGFTGSGTSCTITAIKDGIIVGATCV